MGSAGRHRARERPGGSPESDGEAPPPLWRRIARRVLAVVVLVVLAAGSWWVAGSAHRGASDPRACQSVVEDGWVQGGRECLHFEEYRSASLSAHPDLVVILHGDAPFSRPGYQYAAARRLSTEAGNVIAVGLLRPGYTDDEGHRSSGIRGQAIGDNYTPADVDAITSAITALAETYMTGRVFIVGHSGGAAIAADIIGRHPGVATGAVLVSCPCDVPAWRRHMDSLQHAAIWRLPVQSLSPMDVAERVDPHTVVRVVVGAADHVAPAVFSRGYVQRLQGRGVHADLVEVPKAGHDILLDPQVLRAIAGVLDPTP